MLRVVAVAACLASAGADGGVVVHYPEGSLRGFPIVRDPASGATIGVGTVTQTIAGDVVRVVVDTSYRDGLRVEERMRFRQRQGAPLEQLDWSVDEKNGGDAAAAKHYSVDFTTGRASFPKGGEARGADLGGDHVRGAFAGGGVMYAAKNAIPELLHDATVDLDVVAFTPAPHVVTVTLSHGGRERLKIGGRSLDVDRIVVHPDVPKIAKLVGVKAPDTILWFTHSTPPAVVRADTTIVEPSDRPIRIELLGKP